MKKLILIGIGLVAAAAFIGFDAVDAFVDKTRSSVRSHLMSPEMELEAKISQARELADKCADSVIDGQTALARLDTLIEERERELDRRQAALERDRRVLERRRALLKEEREVYFIAREPVSQRTLNRDALLRAKAYATDREIVEHLDETLRELKMQRHQTAAEIEEAMLEQGRLEEEVKGLVAALENLRARQAVARTREEAAYVFDRSTFDRAREKISEIRTTISEQNKRLDFYGRRARGGKGLLPDDLDATPEESGVDAITAVLQAKAGAPEETECVESVRR